MGERRSDGQERASAGRFQDGNIEPTSGFAFGSKVFRCFFFFPPNVGIRCLKGTRTGLGIGQRRTQVFAFLGNMGYKPASASAGSWLLP